MIIAGVNGAGKTTFARQLLPIVHPACLFLNADEIQREHTRFATPAASGRELLRRLNQCVAIGANFAVETTLSSQMYARRMPAWRKDGYELSLYSLEAISADFAVTRVTQRVLSGGHGIPEADIRRRYARSLKLFPVYRKLADAWYQQC